MLACQQDPWELFGFLLYSFFECPDSSRIQTQVTGPISTTTKSPKTTKSPTSNPKFVKVGEITYMGIGTGSHGMSKNGRLDVTLCKDEDKQACCNTGLKLKNNSPIQGGLNKHKNSK